MRSFKLTTLAEAEAVANLTVVFNAYGDAIQKIDGQWWMTKEIDSIDPRHLFNGIPREAYTPDAVNF